EAHDAAMSGNAMNATETPVDQMRMIFLRVKTAHPRLAAPAGKWQSAICAQTAQSACRRPGRLLARPDHGLPTMRPRAGVGVGVEDVAVAEDARVVLPAKGRLKLAP